MLGARIIAFHLAVAFAAGLAFVALPEAPTATDRLRAALATALAALLAGLWLARAVVQPIAALARATDAAAPPDPATAQVCLSDLAARRDEIGALARGLDALLGRLYARIEANEAFAADVAHEIRAPVAAMHAVLEALGQTGDTDQRADLLAMLAIDLRRLDRLIGDISHAARLDAALVREGQSAVDLRALLLAITDNLRPEADRRGIDFVTDLPDHPTMLHGLEARLAQVFVNLVTNALSFSASGDCVRVWLRERGGRVLAVVEDTGPGIPEAALERIFERFYSERPTDDDGRHSGLGLAISRQIVESHGGAIWAENIRPTAADPASEPMGARFVVALPR
jgi:two-component system sensor histidine kinase ChvG